MSDADRTDNHADLTDDGTLSPGSTATGAGTSMETEGTTEADVSDGRDQKLPRVD